MYSTSTYISVQGCVSSSLLKKYAFARLAIFLILTNYIIRCTTNYFCSLFDMLQAITRMYGKFSFKMISEQFLLRTCFVSEMAVLFVL